MAGRLDADAKSALDAAREVARGHRHEVVEPEHLLRALVADERAGAVLADRAVDCSKLAARIDARLAQWPMSGIYRDAHAEPAEAGVERVVERARTDGVLSRLRPITLPRLTRAACAEPRLAELLSEARAEIETASAAFEQARTLAVARRHDSVSVYHLVRVLVDQPRLADVFRRARIDPGELVSNLESRLEVYVPSPDLIVRLPKTIPTARLLGLLLRLPAVDHLLWEQRATAIDVLKVLARANDDLHDDLPEEDAGDVEILFHDDDFTTMPFVVDVLCRCFAVDQAKATQLMLAVHERGSSIVKTCRGREARWRIEKARAIAELAVMPLRITWRLTGGAA